MAKSVKVKIAGKEYSLKGHNEEIIQKASREVNSQLEALEERYKNETVSTLSVLTALNIAEKYCSIENELNSNKSKVIEELGKMTDFLKNSISYND